MSEVRIVIDNDKIYNTSIPIDVGITLYPGKRIKFKSMDCVVRDSNITKSMLYLFIEELSTETYNVPLDNLTLVDDIDWHEII